MAPKKWTINGDFVQLKPTGVARYGKQVTLALDELIGIGHPLTRDKAIKLVSQKAPDFALENIKVQTVREYRHPRLPQFWVQFQLPFFVEGGLLSFSNLAPVSVRNHVACIHDLHTFLVPHTYSRGFRIAHRIILPALGLRAKRISTVSEFSKGCLVDHGIAAAGKITVTYNGCDHALAWDSRKATVSIGPRPFVLFLAQPQAYKNASLIWRIASDLDKIGLDLYAVGDRQLGPFEAASQTAANVRFLGRVGDNDLAALFDTALCFLFPSRIEGFGIPMMEAMARGCPVVASNAPCLPEIGGDAALYASPDDPHEWLAQIELLRDQPPVRAALQEKSHQRSSLYTWRGVAERYLEIMDEVDRG